MARSGNRARIGHPSHIEADKLTRLALVPIVIETVVSGKVCNQLRISGHGMRVMSEVTNPLARGTPTPRFKVRARSSISSLVGRRCGVPPRRGKIGDCGGTGS
jgi:hypothetical protein